MVIKNAIMEDGQYYDEYIIGSNKDNITEKEKKVLEEMNLFDFPKFFAGKLGLDSCGIGLITRHQAIYIRNFIPFNIGEDYTDHYENLEYVYQVLYGEEIEAGGKDYTIPWQQGIIKEGNILMQFVADGSSVIWVPRDLNEFQEKELKKFNFQIKRTFLSRWYFYLLSPLEFHIGEMEDFDECTNGIDAFLKRLDIYKCSESEFFKEHEKEMESQNQL